MTRSQQPPSFAPSRVAAALIRALWFVVIPALLAGVTFRYGVPGPKSGVSGVLADAAVLLSARPTFTLLGLFLCYVALVRYWSPRLYGASLWLEPRASKAAPFSLKQALVWAGSLAFAAACAFLLRESLFQPYRVLSASMLPTLQPGAELLVKRYAYGFHWPWQNPSHQRLPSRGDLIVFHKDLGPELPSELVKRVIGLPGDSIVVRSGQVWINGWPLPACDAGRYTYLTNDGLLDARLVVEFLEDKTYLTAFFLTDNYGENPFVVPPGEVFVLGDNRSNSSDSRFWNDGRGGGLSVSEIGGRFERRLSGIRRNGEADFSELFKPFDLDIRLEGVDTTDLKQGIELCLKKKPKRTQPPPPFSQQHPQ